MYLRALESVQRFGRIALHFHPERLDRARRSVAEGLLDAGIYKSQFETGLSSGSPSAFPGGDRDRWEDRLFAGAYHAERSSSVERPKYGSLDLLRHPDGPSPRFGSSYLLLKPEVSNRSTFTFGGSQEPEALDRTGTLDALDPVTAPLLARLEEDPDMFGPRMGAVDFLERATRRLREPFQDPEHLPLGRVLDYFVEAQVHGEVALDADVERLVADPAFRAHHVGDVLRAIADKYGFPLSWHAGFRLHASQVPESFRGYPVRALAKRAARGGVVDAATLGECANSFELHPDAWDGWSSRDVLTQFRRLWHVLVLGERADSVPIPEG